MISEDVMRKYRDAIALLQYRKPEMSYHAELIRDFDNKVALKLTCLRHLDSDYGAWTGTSYFTKTFKYADTEDKAVMHFVKVSQNRVF